MPGLPDFIELTPAESDFLSSPASEGRLPVRLTAPIAEAMRSSAEAHGGVLPADDPLRLQFVPRSAELNAAPDELADPLGETEHSPFPRLVHRYPDRALILVTDVCAVHCRYCFRARFTGTNTGAISEIELNEICTYLSNSPAVREIILSGGDGLMLPPEVLETVLRHVRTAVPNGVIRIATRVPVVQPDRVTVRLLGALGSRAPVWIVLQVNHVSELAAPAAEGIARLVDAGVPVVCQTVLLRGVNDRVDALEDLLVRLVQLRVKPYYLFQTDLAPGTSHFRVDLARALDIVGELRTRVSGLSLPEFAVDIPGGGGKVPLEPSAIVETTATGYLLMGPDGRTHQYPRGDL